MAKAPIPGFAKTRLCPPATPEQAAQLAAASLLDTLDAALATGAPVVVALAGDVNDGVMAADVGRALRRVDVIRQRGEGLGERLAHAHADAARLHPGAPVLQIGMDTPQVTAHALTSAMTQLVSPVPDIVSPAPAAVSPAPDAVSPAPNVVSCTLDAVSDIHGVVSGLHDVGFCVADAVPHADEALTHHVDAVLGPATDGGWWALGLRDPANAAVLTDVPMSTSETGERTRFALQARGLRMADLPRLSDVDTMADARRIAPYIPDSRFARMLDNVLAVPAAHKQRGRGA